METRTNIPKTTLLPMNAFVIEAGPQPAMAVDDEVIAHRQAQRPYSSAYEIQAQTVEGMTGVLQDIYETGEVYASRFTLNALACATIVAGWYHVRRPFREGESIPQNRRFRLPRLYDDEHERGFPGIEVLARANRHAQAAVTPAEQAYEQHKAGFIQHKTNKKLGQGLGHAAYELWAVTKAEELKGFPVSELSIQETSKMHSARLVNASLRWARELGVLPSLVALEKDGALAVHLRRAKEVPTADKRRLERLWDPAEARRAAQAMPITAKDEMSFQ